MDKIREIFFNDPGMLLRCDEYMAGWRTRGGFTVTLQKALLCFFTGNRLPVVACPVANET